MSNLEIQPSSSNAINPTLSEELADAGAVEIEPSCTSAGKCASSGSSAASSSMAQNNPTPNRPQNSPSTPLDGRGWGQHGNVSPANAPRSSFSRGVTLTLDLGTKTGWAFLAGSEVIESGTEILASEEELRTQRRQGNERRLDVRFVRLLDFIRHKMGAGVLRIVFEDVQFLGSQCQTQLWASLRTAIWTTALERTSLTICCVSVPTLKRFATGDGASNKSAMAHALATAEPWVYQLDAATGELRRGEIKMDDNEVDAIWLARFAAAVDRGEQQFLGAQERKAIEREHRRLRGLEAKAARKTRTELRKEQARLKGLAFKTLLKAAGRCCGVYRKPASRGRAICPKCGVLIRVQPQTDS